MRRYVEDPAFAPYTQPFGKQVRGWRRRYDAGRLGWLKYHDKLKEAKTRLATEGAAAGLDYDALYYALDRVDVQVNMDLMFRKTYFFGHLAYE